MTYASDSHLSVHHAGKAFPYLSDVLLDPVFSKSYDPEKTAFSKSFKTEKSLFAWLEEEGNENELKLFGYAMNGYRNLAGMGGMSGQMGQGLNSEN